MDRKVVIAIFLMLMLVAGGCGGSESDLPGDAQIIEDLISSKTPAGGAMVGQQNEDIIELKHWKYASERVDVEQPGSAASEISEPALPQEPEEPQLPATDESEYDWEPAFIQLLTQEEIESMIEKLVSLGYLDSPTADEADFQNAIRNFQSDHSLPITGKLDTPTRQLLNKR